MPDERRASAGDGRRGWEMLDRERTRESPWGNEHSYSSGRAYGDRPYAAGEYDWRDRHRDGSYGQPESAFRDYSGVSWGLSGGHRQDREIAQTGAGLEAGYAAYHRPDATDWQGIEHRIPGPYTGRGPRGYQRSDERIREELNDRLAAHGWIDATDIECSVEHGDVLLAGFVDSRTARRAAEDLAEDIAGVRDVSNHLRIRTNAPDAQGVGRTSVLGLTERQAQTRASLPSEPRGSRTRS